MTCDQWRQRDERNPTPTHDASALATHHPLTAFYTGIATALGAGVSSFLRSFVSVTVGGAIIASLSAALGVLAAG
jgi:hypothetical protein